MGSTGFRNPQALVAPTLRYISVTDTLLEQTLFQEIFELCLKEHFSVENTTTMTDDVILTYCRWVKHNALCWWIRSTDTTWAIRKMIWWCVCSICHLLRWNGCCWWRGSYTRKWMDQVNCGGLFPLNDETIYWIEKCLQVYLPRHLIKSSCDE